MPVKSFRNSKRNSERVFLQEKGINIIWHHKRACEVEGLLQIAMNELAKCKNTDAFTIYDRLRARRKYFQSSARELPEDEKGTVVVDPLRLIDTDHQDHTDSDQA